MNPSQRPANEGTGRILRNLLLGTGILYLGFRYYFFAAIETARADYGSGAALTPIALVGVLGAAALCRWTRRLPALLRIEPRDIAFLFIFLLIGGPLLLGVVTFVKGTTHAYYLGNRNEAAQTLMSVGLPRLAPSDEALETIYRGHPDGRIQWQDWFQRSPGARVSPALGWGLYLFFFLALCVGLALVFAPRWVREEQLAFPMTRVGELLANGYRSPVTGERLALFNAPPFWFGLFGTLAFQLATYWSPGLEHRVGSFAVPAAHPLLGALDYASRQFWWRPVFLGLLILCPRPILGSALIFHLALVFLTLGGSALGYHGFTGSDLPGATVFPFKQDQLIGGAMALCLLMIWRARGDLAAQAHSLRRWFRGDSQPKGAPSPVGLMLVLFSLAGFVAWTLFLGFAPRTIFFFLLCLVLGVIVNSRGRAESGMPLIIVFSSFNPLTLVSILGTRLLGAATLAASALHGWLFWNNVAQVTPSLFDALKLGDTMRRSFRWSCGIAVAAVAIGLMLGVAIVFRGVYATGVDQWDYRWGSGSYEMSQAYQLLKRESGFNGLHAAYAIGGGLLVLLLGGLRALYPGFMLHPMGYLLSLHSGLHHFSLALILAYVVKSLCLHYGGMKGYLAVVPLFIGLLCGQILGALAGGVLNLALGTSVYIPSE